MSHLYCVLEESADSSDMCAVHAGIAHVVELAINGDEAALAELHASTLDETLRAMDACKALHCDNHAGEYGARSVLDRVYFAALEAQQEKLDANCEICRGNSCSACV